VDLASDLSVTRLAGRLLLVDGHGQATATLATAVVQDFPAVGSLHPSPEAVGAQAALTMWLICTLHESPPKRQKRERDESMGSNLCQGVGTQSVMPASNPASAKL
jgi:hypothetical protein